MRRALAALTVVLVFVSLTAVGQSTGDYLDDLFAAQDSLARGIDRACQNHPEHPRCAASTTTTAAPTTTQISTTTTTLASTTSTTVAPTTTAPPTTTTVPISTTTTAPSSCQGVQVAAGSNLVNVANAHAAGATFCVAAGTYQIDASLPVQTGDRWIGSLGSDGARQSLLTGRDTTQYLVTATSQNVLFQNFIVERFNNAIQQGVNTGAQTFWTWDNVEVRENNGGGIHTHNDSRVMNSFIHHNHQLGLGGNGDRVLIENNEVSFNNYQGETSPGFEAGGSKWVNAIDTVVRGNFFHHNCGTGIWFDGPGNQNQLIENNRADDNWAAGIFYEMSTGPAVIRNNEAHRNAFGAAGTICDNTPGGNSSNAGNGGIRVNDSRNVEVYDNTLSGNDGGIGAGESDRGERDPDLINLFVHDNNVSFSVGFNGIVDTDAGANPFTANNRYENNTYPVRNNFAWNGSLSLTFAQWQSFGHDN